MHNISKSCTVVIMTFFKMIFNIVTLFLLSDLNKENDGVGVLSVFSGSLAGGPQRAGPQQKLVHFKEACFVFRMADRSYPNLENTWTQDLKSKIK